LNVSKKTENLTFQGQTERGCLKVNKAVILILFQNLLVLKTSMY